MGWRELLSATESLVLPWIGGRHLRVDERIWTLEGKKPQEHCWGQFLCKTNRTATFLGTDLPRPEALQHLEFGYLVGNYLMPDHARAYLAPLEIAGQAEEVFLIDSGIERFARISAGRMFDDGPLIFKSQEFPLGPENYVLNAFLDEKDILRLEGISPSLDAAFRMEVYQREEARRRRAEIEKKRQEEVLRQEKEERRKKLVDQLGDGSSRREMARQDFETAARAALAIGGATYLDHRRAVQKHEMVVRFRLNNRRFECTCDDRTLGIIDSGICLNAHNDDGSFEAGTKGDTWFTLESLPVVILQAQREGKLVVFRHVD